MGLLMKILTKQKKIWYFLYEIVSIQKIPNFSRSNIFSRERKWWSEWCIFYIENFLIRFYKVYGVLQVVCFNHLMTLLFDLCFC